MEIKQAIEYLEEQNKLFPHSFNALSGCFDTAISALEKQIPKKVDIKGRDVMGYKCGACSACGKGATGEYPYCKHCGQKLDWSENDE